MRPEAVVEVRRGGRVESRHLVRFAVCDVHGRERMAAGPIDEPVYPRSAIKPLQALPLVASGAADRFAVGPVELALACASHSGEPAHVEAVGRWLARLDLDESALACGPHPPLSAEAASALLRAGEAPTRLHNNCSGKHAGMLTLCHHLGWPIEGYHLPHHPLQQRVGDTLAALTTTPLAVPPAIDGCGVPNWAVPLRALASAAARFAAGEGVPESWREAATRLVGACRAYPFYLAGTGRACTRIVERLADGIVKTGAEGVYLGYFPKAGLGLALKVADGATRAAEIALLAILDRLGMLDPAARTALADLIERPVTNTRGERVGEIVAGAGLRPAAGGCG